MAQCPCNQRLEAYHDGELADAESREIERHVADCPACAAELARLSAMSRLFASAARPEMPAGAEGRLRRHVGATLERGLLRIAGIWAAMAACVLLSGSIWLMRAGEMPQESAPPWVEVAAASDSNPLHGGGTPVAQWYLADNTQRTEDAP